MRCFLLCLTVMMTAASLAPLPAAANDGKQAGGAACGALAGLPCAMDQWCDFPQESRCGANDRQGTCKPRPDMCAQIFKPVCGCDGKTYSNACMATHAGTDVARDGAC